MVIYFNDQYFKYFALKSAIIILQPINLQFNTNVAVLQYFKLCINIPTVKIKILFKASR